MNPENQHNSEEEIKKSLGETYSDKSIGGGRGLIGIRKNPSSYLGNKSLRGVRQMPNEIIQNAIDEGVFKNAFLKSKGVKLEGPNKYHIFIRIEEDDTVTVRDTGRGIPIDFHEEFKVPTIQILFEELNIGGKGTSFIDKSTSAYSTPTIGKHGMGAACVNACSDFFDVKSNFSRENTIYHIRWEEAVLTLPVTEVSKSDGNYGTTVVFRPSKEIFDTYNVQGNLESRYYNFEWIDHLLTEYAYNTEDIEYHLTFVELGGREINKTYDSNLLTIPNRLNVNEEEIFTITFSDEDRGYQGHLLITAQGNLGQYSIVNMLRVNQGTHVNAIQEAFRRLETSFYKEIQPIIDELKIDIILNRTTLETLGVPELIRFVGYYSALYMDSPDYSGQSKSELDSPIIMNTLPEKVFNELNSKEMYPFLEKLIMSFSNKVLTAVKNFAYGEQRRKEEEDKKEVLAFKKEINKKKAGQIQGSNDKYTEFARARSQNLSDVVVYIVEGSTTFNIMKAIRYAQNEAIYALNRRPINVLNYNLKELKGSTKFTSLYTLLSAEGTRKSKYKMIVLATDYDADGGYINLYIIALILTYFPSIVEQGKLALFESYKFMATNQDYSKVDEEGKPLSGEVVSFKTYEEALEYIKDKEGYRINSYKGTGSIPPHVLREALNNEKNYTVFTSNNVKESLETIKKLLTNTRFKQQYVLDTYGMANINNIYANRNTILKNQEIEFDVNTLEEDFTRERDMSQAIRHVFSLFSDNKISEDAVNKVDDGDLELVDQDDPLMKKRIDEELLSDKHKDSGFGDNFDYGVDGVDLE